ncbi:MAG: SDR family oxidoreductase [Planctomycetota bacterium]|jgi:ribitol 2-dehydrogenase|nr:SDR family oxidoreductase [Planctomycetota bacterium]
MDLNTATILITGASTGIGAATARALVARGAQVALVARSRDTLETLAEELGPSALAIPGDLTQQADNERMVAATLERFGRIDALFANAGTFITGDLADGDPEHWARGIDLNITALLRSIRATSPHLVAQHSGHIILTSSVAGRNWCRGQTVYCATKQAVRAIGEGLRKEMLPHRVKVTLLEPGWVASEFWDGHGSKARLDTAVAEQRAIHSDDIARGVIYALEQPDAVSVGELLIRPVGQEH